MLRRMFVTQAYFNSSTSFLLPISVLQRQGRPSLQARSQTFKTIPKKNTKRPREMVPTIRERANAYKTATYLRSFAWDRTAKNEALRGSPCPLASGIHSSGETRIQRHRPSPHLMALHGFDSAGGITLRPALLQNPPKTRRAACPALGAGQQRTHTQTAGWLGLKVCAHDHPMHYRDLQRSSLKRPFVIMSKKEERKNEERRTGVSQASLLFPTTTVH